MTLAPQGLLLWIAAREGNSDEVGVLLQDGAPVDWEMPDWDEATLTYKNRPVRCQAIHAAAALSPQSPNAGERAREVLTLLLSWRADVAAKASINVGDGHKRELEAIHIAAGMGCSEAVETLLEYGALPNAEATIDGTMHYLPLHDAAWFNQVRNARCLINHKAAADATNKRGDTALHIAAGLGNVEFVEALLQTTEVAETASPSKPGKRSRQKCFLRRASAGNRLGSTSSTEDEAKMRLLEIVNRDGKVALDLAVERGQFPARSLSLFTDCLDREAKVEAFVKVAIACPDAAPTLLRASNGQDNPDLDARVSEEWRESLLLGVESGLITVHVLASLLQRAPQAAADLIDVLATVPTVQNREHNPLPVRARIRDQYSICRLSAAYEEQNEWHWSPIHFDSHWQKELAPFDAKLGHEVKIRVIQLPGIINCEVVHCLAGSRDHAIFTKLVVHGLLKFMWSRFIWLFLLDLVHEAAAMAVISYWIWGGSFNPDWPMLKLAMWCIVASLGVNECVTTIWTTVVCWRRLGKDQLLPWMVRTLHRGIIGVITSALALDTWEALGPQHNGNSDVILSVSGLLHWLLMLFQLRAFQWTGKRLLPIMKAVQPVTAMLVIMLFLGVGFAHAFWALGTYPVDMISLFSISILLFTGAPGEISETDLRIMDPELRDFTIMMMIGCLFLFLTCTINVFIAVLGDCYDQEQEKMIRSFLRERARICSGFFLRPGVHLPCLQRIKESRHGGLVVAILVVMVAGAYLGILRIFEEARSATWVPALILFALAQLTHGLAKRALMEGWDQRHLWICHEVSIHEEMFLVPDERDQVEQHGRIARIKQYVLDQSKMLASRCNVLEQSLAETRADIVVRLALQGRKLDRLLPEACAAEAPATKQAEATSNMIPHRSSSGMASTDTLGGLVFGHITTLAHVDPATCPRPAGQDMPALRHRLGELEEAAREMRMLLEQQQAAQQRLEALCVAVGKGLLAEQAALDSSHCAGVEGGAWSQTLT